MKWSAGFSHEGKYFCSHVIEMVCSLYFFFFCHFFISKKWCAVEREVCGSNGLVGDDV